MTIEQLLDAAAVRLIAEDVGGVDVTVNLALVDVGEVSGDTWKVSLSNRAMSASPGCIETADATATLDRGVLVEIGAAELTIGDAIETGRVTVDGDADAVRAVFGHLDTFMSMFPIVEP
jgi:alkyl sulfatase BDS1-like metallo-beta-lactamase superfamily hydrolase